VLPYLVFIVDPRLVAHGFFAGGLRARRAKAEPALHFP